MDCLVYMDTPVIRSVYLIPSPQGIIVYQDLTGFKVCALMEGRMGL